jgi:hypothetical protein
MKSKSSPNPPKPANQGSHKGAPTQAPKGSGKPTGGRGGAPSAPMQKQTFRGMAPKPVGGSGSGAHKGDSLPR